MGRICQKCHKTYSSRQSLWNHKKYCKGGNVNTLHSILSQVESRVKETDLTSNISEISAKKRKVDCLGESKDISSFEEPELSGTKPLPSETLLRTMETLKNNVENQIRMLKQGNLLYKAEITANINN